MELTEKEFMKQLLLKTADALKTKGFEAFIAESREDVIRLATSLLSEGCSITWGGSKTIRDIGLTEAVKRKGYLVYDRDELPREARMAFAKEHYFSDWYFTSSNAITEDGELLNLDGIGNRVASMIWGPANVLVVAGVNKIVPTLTDAYKRVREIAAPKNAQRFDIETPCKKTGKCANCLSPDTICAQMVHLRVCKPKGRIRVILIDEELGY